MSRDVKMAVANVTPRLLGHAASSGIKPGSTIVDRSGSALVTVRRRLRSTKLRSRGLALPRRRQRMACRHGDKLSLAHSLVSLADFLSNHLDGVSDFERFYERFSSLSPDSASVSG